LSDLDTGGTGTWLGAMARGLLDSGAVELAIIATGPVSQFTRSDHRQVNQWLVPGNISLGRDGLPPAPLVQDIVGAVQDFSPDIVHTWGTEAFWGLLPARGLLTYPSLLLIQGLKGPIARIFAGQLTLSEQIRCIGIKEVLKRRTMRAERRDFERWALREEEMIRGHRFIDAQSSWGAAHVKALNPGARLFSNDLPLRGAFYGGDGWRPSGGPPIVFCTAAYTSPFKGLHVAIRALASVRMRIPDVRLRIAGPHQRPGIRQDGYIRWINRLIRQLGLVDAIEWLGPLNAEQLVGQLRAAAAVVIPTFIETYCVVFAEAMSIGTPVVVSYAGGTSSLGKDEDSCLFFAPGDAAMCAYQLERLLTDGELALRLSRESLKIAKVRSDHQQIVQRQLEIYRQILTEDKRA